MTRLSLLAIAALALLMAVPSGQALAQVPVAVSAATFEGTAVIWDNQSLSDAVTYSMTGVTTPAAGTAYEGWLVSDDGAIKLSTGVMTLASDGSISHSYTSPTGENLIAGYDKVVITVEPVPDLDPTPSGIVAYSDQIPTPGITHIRHLLVSWKPPPAKGILTNLKEQLAVALAHANLAANSATLSSVQLHAHHVINIIEGEAGANFDASFGNPGDGKGVLLHATDRKHAGFAAGAAAEVATLVAQAALVDITGKNAGDFATLASAEAVRVAAQTDIAIAKLFLAGVRGLLESAIDGRDANANGTIESVAGEGGAKQAYVEAQRMATYNLKAGPPPVATPTPEPQAPVTGDPTVPTLARLALWTSILLLVAGGLVVLNGRRSRTRS
jgi:hypothetical protein